MIERGQGFTRLTDFLRARILVPFKHLLKQGVTPGKLALCIATGAVIGVFPVIGATMILCGIAGYFLRLNMIAIQAVNYAVYPLQIILLVPFVRFGEYISSSEKFPVSMQSFQALLFEGNTQTLRDFLLAVMHGVLGWLVLALPAGLVLYLVFLPILKKAGEQYAKLKRR